MVQTDPIADMLTRIRNAGRARLAFVELPTSKVKQNLAELLEREGYVGGVQVMPGTPRKTLRIQIRYRRPGEPMIREIRRVSRPGCRYYASKEEIAGWKHGITTTLLSTSKGLMTHRQAIEANLGGEVILKVE